MIHLFKRKKPISGRRIDLDKDYRAAHLDEVPVTEMTEEEFFIYEQAKLDKMMKRLDHIIEIESSAYNKLQDYYKSKGV